MSVCRPSVLAVSFNYFSRYQFTIKNSTDPLPREKAVPFILCGFFYNVRCVVVFNGFPVQGLFMANERYD